jgi:type III restriction enzyme
MTYLRERCFSVPKQIDSDPAVRKLLADPQRQNQIAKKLARKIGEVTAETQPIKIQASPLRMSDTENFLWRRQHEPMAKTIFNEVATFNNFERDFAKFLADKCNDVDRFAALAETFTKFRVEYLKPNGAIGLYYPDWVVVQSAMDSEVNWIIETKGRVWEGTEQKDAAIAHWCEQVSLASGESWNYMRVDQIAWKPMHFTCFADLVESVKERSKLVEDRILAGPATELGS